MLAIIPNDLLESIKEKPFDNAKIERAMREWLSPQTKPKNGLSLLHLAAHAQNHKLCDALIHQGANANAISDKGFTPLHSAIAGCSETYETEDLLATVSALLKGGANPDSRIPGSSVSIKEYALCKGFYTVSRMMS